MSENNMIDLSGLSMEDSIALFQAHDKNLEILRQFYNVELVFRDMKLHVLKADDEIHDELNKTIQLLIEMIKQGIQIQERDIVYAANMVKSKKDIDMSKLYQKAVGRTTHGKLIFPKTIGQRYLIHSMSKNDIVFAVGVAGTGKTYLAVVYAVSLLKNGDIAKIVLTRPAVEAGENLGFLPGDLKEKVDPYLRPLYDALHDTLGEETTTRYIEKGVIEIAPLAYMRGRTLDNAFIILDEAQNTTRSQMKMFLTRMGFNSKIVVTGDITQIDLIQKKDSGLIEAKEILDGLKGIAFCELTSLDVVRNPMVQKIIERYESRGK